jgi:hypothetical protein
MQIAKLAMVNKSEILLNMIFVFNLYIVLNNLYKLKQNNKRKILIIE